ncbi:MAG: methyl-accepting chemotaxis protein [Methanolobus sp.]
MRKIREAAAKQIATLISEIREGTDNAVVSIQQGSKVSNGAEALNEVALDIDQVVESGGIIASMVQDIAAAAQEQSASIEEITSSVEEVSAISEESAAKVPRKLQHLCRNRTLPCMKLQDQQNSFHACQPT